MAERDDGGQGPYPCPPSGPHSRRETTECCGAYLPDIGNTITRRELLTDALYLIGYLILVGIVIAILIEEA